MTSFFEFIQREIQGLLLPAPTSTGNAGQTSLVTRTAVVLEDAKVPADKALKFGQELAKLVASESFLKELSNEIREPGLTETEEEFVLRCKVAMRKLLDRHLDK